VRPYREEGNGRPVAGWLRRSWQAPSRARALALFLPLILLCYFGSLAVAAYYFPEPYDWRYRVISNLLSPRDNPDFYRIPSAGIALGAIFMLPIFAYIDERLRPVARRASRAAYLALAAGAALLGLAATIVPQHVRPVFGIRKLHEILAHSSAVFFGVGMILCCWCALRDRLAIPSRRLLDRRLWPAWLTLTLGPILSLCLSEALLILSWHWPQWGPAVRQTMHQTVFWHLGFWEWSGAGAIYLFLAAAVVWLPERATSCQTGSSSRPYPADSAAP